MFRRKVNRGGNTAIFKYNSLTAGLNFQTFAIKALLVTTKPQMVNAITMRFQKYK